MQGLVLDQDNASGINIKEVSLPDLKPQEVKVKVIAAALNHRDEWCRQGKYPNIKDGIILGSDGAGVVEAVGESVDKAWLGKEVIINAANFWGDDQSVQSADFQILGMPTNGTMAEYVHVNVSRLCDKPQHLTFEEAAALPLAGLTAYRAVLYHGQLKPGRQLLVTGFGGGVAQFAAQFGVAAGADVYVNSSSEEKLSKAKALGAIAGFNYKDENWVQSALDQTGGFDLVVDSAMGDTFPLLIKVLKPGGKLVFYGATLGNPPMMDARRVFWNQLTIQGTTMGSDQDFAEMVAFVESHQITPLVDSIFSFSDARTAFDRMAEGKQTGKIVLKI
ncbi:zinc-binding dehydrogenase [Echinicola vietnamensis]|uniref:Zn-dependent oxidoreductase, NADPH:quinone reductase n=1 Tax=Echinicola vietnamensis (strain DSM 17526 / LMG 23754 / KMM 6221) TaxID=926556 RepID=L0G0W3_ECHVK|nr:zinc-binding dehydrogenase [Echinicola vietnamensis]AGA79187.1 Zn-dependent oxidoreductase, NADPH:quinone reductase [Echinicola vietnamensis DSM 17526]